MASLVCRARPREEANAGATNKGRTNAATMDAAAERCGASAARRAANLHRTRSASTRANARLPQLAALVLALALASTALAKPPTELALIAPTDPLERITGVFCQSSTACVITSEYSEEGHLYASDGTAITATLITSDYDLGEAFGVLGAVDLMGFAQVGDTVYVLIDGAADALLTNTGDVTDPDAWQRSKLGLPEGRDSFGGNQQIGLGTDGSGWTLFLRSMVYTGDDPPGRGAIWYETWAPVPPGERPNDISQRAREDPTLCIAAPSVGISPTLTQMGYVAPDLSLVVYPAGARNQQGTAEPGVCVSTDGGETFHHVPFEGVEGDLGPLGVTCEGEVCAAYGGLQNEPHSVYVFVTHDAGATWARATLPSLRDDARFRAADFAPGGVVGWAVGAVGAAAPLVLVTTDGGRTWTDASSLVRAHAADVRLHTVYAPDEDHVWIGGENGLLLSGGY